MLESSGKAPEWSDLNRDQNVARKVNYLAMRPLMSLERMEKFVGDDDLTDIVLRTYEAFLLHGSDYARDFTLNEILESGGLLPHGCGATEQAADCPKYRADG